MIKKVIKIIAYTFLLAFLLLATYILYAWVINWHDEPLSETSLEFQEFYDTNFSKSVENNAYALMLGFDVPEHENPLARGEERIRWSYTMVDVPEEDRPYQFPGPVAEYFASPPPDASQFEKVCTLRSPNCVPAVLDNPSFVENLLSEHPWVVTRYADMLAMDEFVENTYLDYFFILPPYHHILASQRLYLISEVLMKGVSSPQDLHQALNRDLEFWRRVQRDSATLITRMIAIAAIQQHLFLTNELYKQLSSESLVDIFPAALFEPMNEEELSLYSVFSGEWVFSNNSIKYINQYEFPTDLYDDDWWSLPRPISDKLFQPQGTQNLLSENFMVYLKHYDRPLSDYPQALSEDPPLRTYDNVWSLIRNPYNAAGKIHISINSPAYEEYLLRVADLEGARRAMVLISEMRLQQIPVAAAQAYIEQSDIKNPYTNKPFEWDEEVQALVFNGLQPDDRGRHAFIY